MEAGVGNSNTVATTRVAVQELFQRYLGRSIFAKIDSTGPENSASKLANRLAYGLQLPKDEQFSVDFLRLQNQFPDHDQLQSITESLLALLLVQCGSNMLQAEFLLFALQTLTRMGLVQWDGFIPLLLRATSVAETGNLNIYGGVGNGTGMLDPSILFHSLSSSPVVIETSSNVQAPASGKESVNNLIAWLRPLVCKVALIALQTELKPVPCFEILCQIVQWTNEFTHKEINGSDSSKHRTFGVSTWLYDCLEVLWALVGRERCHVPFYALLHDQTQLHIDYWPEDETLLHLFLEVHRRRDRIALHMQTFDGHLLCPTFATLRMVSLTYPGAMGEPLHGEEVASSIKRGTLDWERALRCLRHGLRCNPSTDYWRRVLLFAPCYKQQLQQSAAPRAGPFGWTQPGYIFSSEMTCEAVVERIMDLMQASATGSSNTMVGSSVVSENARWQEWLTFADLFYFFMRRGYLDFVEFIDKLEAAFASNEQPPLRTNHVTWLLAQVFRLETVTSALNTDSKAETMQKILSFHMSERPLEQATNITPQSMLLDFVGSSQILRLWALNRAVKEHLTGNRMPEHIQKGKAIDEWWKQVQNRERVLDYANLDDRATGMVWVLSHTVTQPICDAIMTWMKANGIGEVALLGQPGERLAIVQETRPLPVSTLSGLSLHLCMRLINQIEDQIFAGQVLPSIAMLETYVRLLLIAPQTLFQLHLNGMMQKNQPGNGKSGVSLILLEILNYRLIPLYRFHGKTKQLLFDVTKIINPMKSKRGDHRLFRLAENLGINLILSLREVLLMKKEKGATDFTETMNRIMILSLAITMKTRGIAEFENWYILPHAVEQILANSQHTWSEKTMRHFPQFLREALAMRPDRRGQSIQTWQQIEHTVMHQLRPLLSPNADPSYCSTFLNHVFPPQRQYVCAGVWMFMDGHPESINTGNLARVLKEFSPEEVTSNVYTLVDVLLHNIQLQCQHGHSKQDLFLRASSGLTSLIWQQELLPFDILLLALIDRDDDQHALRLMVSLLLDRPEFQQRVNHYCMNRTKQEHWMLSGCFERPDPHQALGSYLAGKERFPVFFDDMCLRALPVIPLVIYRLIENEAMDTADRVLHTYAPLLFYHPQRFTFVRETLAYFYGHLPNKLVLRLLSILDLGKIPVSDAFVHHIRSHNSECPPNDYFANLLLGLVHNIIPPLHGKARANMSNTDSLSVSSRAGPNKGGPTSGPTMGSADSHRAYYHHQDPGSYHQLILETAVIELLSLPSPPNQPPNQIVSTMIQIAVRVSLPNSSAGQCTTPSGNPRSPLLPTSPPPDSLAASSSPSSCLVQPQIFSPLIIQACGLLLAQMPTPFHTAFYVECARIIKECWWLMDSTKASKELDTAFGYSAWDPTWAVQDGTSNVIGNTVALLHAFASALPFEWLEGMHNVITQQRPIVSVAHLRLAFRILGPLLPRLVMSRPLFSKTLALLFTIMADVFGRSSQPSPTTDLSDISDLIDFLHHAVMLEVQGTGQTGARPKPETLRLCSKAIERLRPDLQHLFRHLSEDVRSSVYAATHPKLFQRTPPTFTF